MSTATVKRPRRWIWFWVALVTLATAGITIPIVYNLAQQLKPEEVVAARAKWEASGIKDYDLAYQERLDNEETGTAFRVKVRDGKVIAATIDGEPLPQREWPNHTVEAMFDRISRDLNEDMTSGQRRNYASAHFDKKHGFPIRYVFRIRGTKKRTEWNIRLTQVTR